MFNIYNTNYLNQMSILTEVSNKITKKNQELDQNIFELKTKQSGWWGSSINYITQKPILSLVGRNIQFINSEIETQKSLESNIGKLRQEIKQAKEQEIQLKKLSQELDESYRNYLANPNKDNALKVQKVIDQIFLEIPDAAENLKKDIKKISILSPIQGKLHNLMLLHIAAPRRLEEDLPLELLLEIISYTDLKDLPNIALNKKLSASVKAFLTGNNPAALARFLEKNHAAISQEKYLELAKNCGSSLTKLNLNANIENFYIVSDHQIQEIVAKCPNLQEIYLQNCIDVTDKTLESFTKLDKLRIFNLNGCSEITNKGLEFLAKLPNLQELYLRSCKDITDQGLESLANLNLLKLDLSSTQITDKGVLKLGNLTNLLWIDLRYCNITDQALQTIANFSELEHLDLNECDQITDQGIRSLINLTKLKMLNLYECDQITDLGLQILANLKDLEILDLQGLKLITDNGLKLIGKLLKLKFLNLSGCSLITDITLKGLEKLTNLERLELWHCNMITDDGVETLAAKKGLSLYR